MAAKKKVLIITSDDINMMQPYAAALEQRANCEITSMSARTTEDFRHCTQHIREKGDTYDAAIMTHVGDFESARTTDHGASSIPDMKLWVTAAQKHMPNAKVIIVDTPLSLGSSLWNELGNAGLEMRNQSEVNPGDLVASINLIPSRSTSSSTAVPPGPKDVVANTLASGQQSHSARGNANSTDAGRVIPKSTGGQ